MLKTCCLSGRKNSGFLDRKFPDNSCEGRSCYLWEFISCIRFSIRGYNSGLISLSLPAYTCIYNIHAYTSNTTKHIHNSSLPLSLSIFLQYMSIQESPYVSIFLPILPAYFSPREIKLKLSGDMSSNKIWDWYIPPPPRPAPPPYLSPRPVSPLSSYLLLLLPPPHPLTSSPSSFSFQSCNRIKGRPKGIKFTRWLVFEVILLKPVLR